MSENISNEQKEKYIQQLSSELVMLRAKANMTQEYLSNLVGISRQTYCAIETQKKSMSWSTYLALIFVFDSMQETSAVIRKLGILPANMIEQLNSQKEVNQ